MTQVAKSPAYPPLVSSALETRLAGPPRLSALVMEARPAFSRHAKLIEGLRRRIHDIERHVPVLGTQPRAGRHVPWTLGAIEADTRLGSSGLDTTAVHEIKPAKAGASAAIASMSFVLRLAARRLQQLKALHPEAEPPRILWCVTRNSTHETGDLYAPGLKAFGLDPADILIVETARASETLWAMEEGLKSASLALVIGQPGSVDLTPARRLSLAAEQSATPCLLLTPHRASPAAATSTRWRIEPAPSSPHRFDANVPGHPRLKLTLERCQHLNGNPLSLVLEWPHATECQAYRLPVAPALADRTLGPPHPWRRTG